MRLLLELARSIAAMPETASVPNAETGVAARWCGQERRLGECLALVDELERNPIRPGPYRCATNGGFAPVAA